MSDGGADTFRKNSAAVARAFLHTAVFLDDHAFPSEDQREPATDSLVSPGGPLADDENVTEGSVSDAVNEGADVAVAPLSGEAQPVLDGASTATRSGDTTRKREPPAVEPAPDVDPFDARTTIEAFARQELVCAVLQPDRRGGLQAPLDAARRADVVVLDWVIHGDHGRMTGDLVAQILKADIERGGRLRLIAIYTIGPDLAAIADELQKRLSKDDLEATRKGSFVIEADNYRIVVLAKPGARTPDAQQVVASGDLPARLQEEFAALASGLIRNLALRGLSVLRDNTHELLARLGRDLDPGFAAHRALLPVPDDAERHAEEVLAGELSSMLRAFDVGAEASLVRTHAWLAHQGGKYEMAFDGKNSKPVSLDELEKLLTGGINNWTDAAIGKKETKGCRDRFFKHATKTFVPVVTDRETIADLSDLRFAVVTSTAHHYDRRRARPDEELPPPPWLRLGTIICNDTAEQRRYLLCIQPRCDSVRLKDREPNKFAFLVASAVEPPKQFDIVVEDGPKNFQRLKVAGRVADIHTESFESKGGVVRATWNDNGYYFAGSAGAFRWIAQLKDGHAQRVANRFASELSRVGVNESEWLRRSARGS